MQPFAVHAREPNALATDLVCRVVRWEHDVGADVRIEHAVDVNEEERSVLHHGPPGDLTDALASLEGHEGRDR